MRATNAAQTGHKRRAQHIKFYLTIDDTWNKAARKTNEALMKKYASKRAIG